MSGDTNGQVAGAVTTGSGIALLPETSGGLTQWLTIIAITCGVVMLVSFTASRMYRNHKG